MSHKLKMLRVIICRLLSPGSCMGRLQYAFWKVVLVTISASRQGMCQMHACLVPCCHAAMPVLAGLKVLPGRVHMDVYVCIGGLRFELTGVRKPLPRSSS